MRRLIDSCHEAHEEFRSASEAVDDTVLKRLFALYAQQRTRFAHELLDYASEEPIAFRSSSPAVNLAGNRSDADLLNLCLEKERSALALYREALADRTIPTKAHFLISAQLALLERVHSRMESLRPSPRPLQTHSERATL
ncbi:MAG TPA: hypothetical protein VK633_02100 [Verrucomicrobiae bacterium]|nr:hypothetical protein [Verrucomicrobiae bacterium]